MIQEKVNKNSHLEAKEKKRNFSVAIYQQEKERRAIKVINV